MPKLATSLPAELQNKWMTFSEAVRELCVPAAGFLEGVTQSTKPAVAQHDPAAEIFPQLFGVQGQAVLDRSAVNEIARNPELLRRIKAESVQRLIGKPMLFGGGGEFTISEHIDDAPDQQ